MLRYLTIATAALALTTQGLYGCACHSAPGFVAPHGGDIEESNREHHVELVADSAQVSLWIMDHELEMLPLDAVEISAQLKLPRSNREPIPLELRARGNRYVANINLPRRTHRYTVLVTLKDGAWSDTIEFNVEP